MSELKLFESRHPDKRAQRRYDELIGIDDQKQRLLDDLILLFEPERFTRWRKKHHPTLPFAEAGQMRSPMVLLSGEVGCGKTALATSVATPLAEALDRDVLTMETPSDIRGWGRVGEISARLTDAFSQAKMRARDVKAGILLLDEADDLATSRAQMQAHHEDRAGLNVLIKQIDILEREQVPLVVVLITNRASVVDPAVLRRAALHLKFERPDQTARKQIFERILAGTDANPRSVSELVRATDDREIPYTASDLFERVGRLALRRAFSVDRPFGADILLETLRSVEPSPLLEGPSAVTKP